MRRLLALLAALLLALGLAGCGDDDDDAATAADDTTTTAAEADEPTTTAAPDAEPAGGATVAVAETDLGEVLVDANGMTLYLFTQDTAEGSACTDSCVGAWPPLTGESVAGEGVDQSLLTVEPRTDGDGQIAYNGHRLYTYSGDSAPGDTTGQGVGDVWFAVTPAGEAVPA
jgi:predicted lipoprotein with Yx(FWY)xxD motif